MAVDFDGMVSIFRQEIPRAFAGTQLAVDVVGERISPTVHRFPFGGITGYLEVAEHAGSLLVSCITEGQPNGKKELWMLQRM